MVCPNHPDQRATKFRVHFKGVKKRASSYLEASRFLTGLRFKADEKSFDPRDYKKDSPLGFKNLVSQWLEIKEKEVKPNSFRDINSTINKALEFWGNLNIKEIKPKDFQLFLVSLNVSDKTKHNHIATLKQFWRWLFDNDEIDRLPKFPKVDFKLAWRKTIDKKTQQAIIDEVKNISYHINPKIWLGIKMLATYFNTRPNELRNMKEGDIDLNQRQILLTDTKDKPKYIYLLNEHIELLKSFPRGLPHLYFFRHKTGQQFGKDYFYKWWKKACNNLDIEGVDLYGGTRHSTVSDLRKHRTPEQIKLASMHTTNKAFERYFQVEADDLREIYQDAQGGKEMGKKNGDLS